LSFLDSLVHGVDLLPKSHLKRLHESRDRFERRFSQAAYAKRGGTGFGISMAPV
jgi:hypothetical protein